jgi:ferredoxin
MKSAIYYYTGTGNSLWAARLLAAELGDTRVLPMRRAAPETDDSEVLGLVFPVHIWGVPRRVVDFVKNLPEGRARYCYAVAVNAGQVASTLKQLERLLKRRGIKLAAGCGLVMPSNYIPWGGAAPEDVQRGLFDAAAKKLQAFAGPVKRRAAGEVEKGPLWQRLLLSGVCYNLTFGKVPSLDKNFHSDDKCNGCSLCTAVCPSGDILMEGGRPSWLGHCEQCLACLQWCPLEAIQYGEKTRLYARYRHPEVTLSDMRA